ncbi:MAG: U32 family peptidase [Planctomycetales bacterium]|nr:U32 family peptidase [Planctomycetales bacterium]
MSSTRSSAELLAPAGDRTCIQAAIENGANAVYFGLTRGFNARARAENMSLDDIEDIMAQLHARGVKGYLTLNTLVFSSELENFEQTVRRVAAAGVDAVLVQDLGAAALIRRICPTLPIHASTQMTLTSAECISAIHDLGIERVVLPRELSVDEISQIAQNTPTSLEAFVHGALCVAYSGQCLTSESLGGRSANRGQCAQACRLPYELYCDGQHVPLDQQQYLLSPQDLAAYAHLPELLQAGVYSFKIEGRLKSPEYVASVTQHYRAALDHALQGAPLTLSDEAIEEMSLTFSRGFAPGWLEGCDHKRLVPADSSAKRGIRIGEVVSVRGQRIRVRLLGSVRTGDGVMFDCHQAQNDQPGGRIFEIFDLNGARHDRVGTGTWELAFRHDSIDVSMLAPGTAIWKTDSPEITRRLRKSFETTAPRQSMPLDLQVEAATGSKLRVIAQVNGTASVTIDSEYELSAARKHPLTMSVLREQFARLGHTPYELRELTANIVGSPMVPLSVLGEVRRSMIELLDQQLVIPTTRVLAPGLTLPTLRPQLTEPHESPPQLTWLCRNLEHLRILLALGINDVIVDFADIREYREATQLAIAADVRIWLATPRIQKPGEAGVFRALQRHGASGILARNLAAIEYFLATDVAVVADYTLNVANELTAAFIKRLGVDRMTASYDLNRDQLLELLEHTPPEWLEVVIHQHMPMFHMEHCVFCAVLSPGTNKTNCGRPCDEHLVHLEDRVGMKHRLTADVGCRNTLFNAQPQSAAELVPTLISRGLRSFRVELLGDESQSLVHLMHQQYLQLLAGDTTGQAVLAALQAVNRVGVTRGTLEAARDPLSIL